MTEKETLKIGQGKAGPGRKKGVPNKVNTALKEAILQAAEAAGGAGGIVGYLTLQAKESPAAFIGLLGKIIPTQTEVTGANGGPIQTQDVPATQRLAERLAAIEQRSGTAGETASE